MQNCPVCDSTYTSYVRDVQGQRTKNQIPLSMCFKCLSAWNPSGFEKGEAVLQSDVEWNKSVEQRNLDNSTKLLNVLRGLNVSLDFICDIGCGTGTLLLAARNQGVLGMGFDINHFATDYGVHAHGLELRNDRWSPSVPLPVKPTLYTSISVCNHLDTPREMLSDLCEASARDGAAAFVSVPIFGDEERKYLVKAGPLGPSNFFFDNDVHVMHFSVEGLNSCFRDFGAKTINWVNGGIWYGAVVRF